MSTTAQSPADWLLEVNNLSCGYGGDSVVKDVSFALSHGDIGCLLGPSGCGKSTILRALAGFLPLSGGEISLQSQAISLPGRTLPPEKRRIGMVFQDYALFPHLTIADNVGFGLRNLNKAEKRQKVMELLNVVHLQDLADNYPHELSGGQQQRVALARALAPRPAILLADEPTGNLDESNGAAVMDLLFGLRDRYGATLVMVTHAPELAARCDRVVRLRDGRLMEDQTAHEAAE